MRRASLSLLALSFGLAIFGLTYADDDKKSATKDKDAVAKKDDSKQDEMKKDDKSTEKPRLRGQLPANYKKLALSQDQVQKIYKIQSDYDKKLAELEEQLKKMKDEEKKEIEGVLTPAQKARLKEIKADK